MGTDRIADVVCMYCGQVTGKKAVNVPDFFYPGGIIATHGICGDCLLKLYPQLFGPDWEVELETEDH